MMQQVYAYYSLDVGEIKEILNDLIHRGLVIEQFKTMQDLDDLTYTLIVIVRPGEDAWKELISNGNAENLAY